MSAISAIVPIPVIPNFVTGLGSITTIATPGGSSSSLSNLISASSGVPTTTSITGPSASTSGFGNSLASAIDSLSSAQNASNAQALAVSTGQANIGDAMLASQKASLDTQLAVAVKTAAVGAFNQIMAMQV